MEECELCGRQMNSTYVINVEGVEMRACISCAKGNKVVRIESDRPPAQSGQPRGTRRQQPQDDELIDGYGKAIREARGRMKLPLKVLAEMLNEKEHLLSRVEDESTRPTIELTKKLEHALKIKLTEKTEEVKHIGTKRGGEATIGDFMGDK